MRQDARHALVLRLQVALQLVGALVKADAPNTTEVAVIPMGTANDFATAAGISTDPWEALQLAVHDTAHAVDIGRVNGEVIIFWSFSEFHTAMISDLTEGNIWHFDLTANKLCVVYLEFVFHECFHCCCFATWLATLDPAKLPKSVILTSAGFCECGDRRLWHGDHRPD